MKMAEQPKAVGKAKVVPAKTEATASNVKMVVPPRVGYVPKEMSPPPVPPRRWAEAAKELRAEMNAVAKEVSAKQAAQLGADVPKSVGGPVKRGARPDRPSQVNREAGRSWERMAERLSDLKAELATTTAALENTVAETVELQGKMAEMEAEQGQKVKMLTEQISQLEAANFQVTAAHNQLLASLPELGHSGQYKQLFEQAEAARADLQKRLEKNTADHLRQMQVMLDEKQAAAEERRAQLVKEHVRQLQKKESEVKEQSREVTALREELLQKDAQIKALQTQAQREKVRVRENKRVTRGISRIQFGRCPEPKTSRRRSRSRSSPRCLASFSRLLSTLLLELGRLPQGWCPPRRKRRRCRSKRHRLLLDKLHIHILSLPEIERPSPKM